ncbi:hypothetical protein RRG08_049150 [Elysia crispata]|uniref:Uncharacterized protein n=1 Tax=Elysia crispata TaxID=231223 RepID=A0AAE1D1C6_9GAST|nr:hypothetical protein RRG08_049150 [Elysia crispata]
MNTEIDYQIFYSSIPSARSAVPHHHLVPCIMKLPVAMITPSLPCLTMHVADLVELCGQAESQTRQPLHVPCRNTRSRTPPQSIISPTTISTSWQNVFADRSGSRAILGDLGLALEVKDDSKTAIAGLVGGTRELCGHLRFCRRTLMPELIHSK